MSLVQKFIQSFIAHLPSKRHPKERSMAGRGWSTAFFHQRGKVQAQENRAVPGEVHGLIWVHTTCSYLSRESKRKHLDMYIATWHCQDTQAHDLIFYKSAVCNWLKKESNSPLPQIVWEALPEREQYIIQCNLHTHKMVKMVPTRQNWDFLCSGSPSVHRKLMRWIGVNETKGPNPLSSPIPSLVRWEECVPFYWFTIWQRQGNQSKEEWEGHSSEDPASSWTYTGLRVNKLHTLQIEKSVHF